MSAARTLLFFAFGAAVVALAVDATGCVDTEPFVVIPDAAPPPPVDAAPPLDAGADVDLRSPCQRCLETPDNPGPGCGDELQQCLDDPKCHGAYTCMLADGCLTKTSQLEIVVCGIPCARDAGIVSQNEPSADLIYNVATCAETTCPHECQPYLFDGGDQ